MLTGLGVMCRRSCSALFVAQRSHVAADRQLLRHRHIRVTDSARPETGSSANRSRRGGRFNGEGSASLIDGASVGADSAAPRRRPTCYGRTGAYIGARRRKRLKAAETRCWRAIALTAARTFGRQSGPDMATRMSVPDEEMAAPWPNFVSREPTAGSFGLR